MAELTLQKMSVSRNAQCAGSSRLLRFSSFVKNGKSKRRPLCATRTGVPAPRHCRSMKSKSLGPTSLHENSILQELDSRRDCQAVLSLHMQS